MTSTHPESPVTTRPASTVQAKRSAISALLGGTLEYYDFLLYASAAAIIFPTVFFPDASAAPLLSFATFGVAYLARPLGGLIIGHFGDRFGRKNALLLTLVSMGAATFLIGCLPTYDQVGMLAPILLVLLRLVQGFSAGGETAGAGSLTVEHAPEGRRGFFGSFTIQGAGAGYVLASLVFIPVAAMPDEILFTWGWRLPFLASFAVLFLSFWVRRRIQEPEVFVEAKEQGKIRKVPVVEVFRTNWRGVLRVAAATMHFFADTLIAVFGVAFAISMGMDRTTALWSTVIAQSLGLIVRPYAGHLSDRFGRKPVFAFGTIAVGVLTYFYLGAIAAGSVPGLFITQALLSGVGMAVCGAVYPTFFAEQFKAPVRYTGMAVGMTVGAMISGFIPTVAQSFMVADSGNWLPAAIIVSGALLIATIAVLTARETAHTHLQDLGFTPAEIAERDHGAPQAEVMDSRDAVDDRGTRTR